MYSIILCGGSGTRLWPLSRKNFPKQFLNLYSDRSLLQETYLRMRKIMPAEKIFFITNNDNFYYVYNQIKDVEKCVNKEQIIKEPMGRNTAPAIALATKFIIEKFNANPDEPIVFLPSDHYIGDEKSYLTLLAEAANNTGNNIGTIGIKPALPETGFGYIKKGEKVDGYFKALEFKEKPDKKTAEKYLSSGEYVWNSGMYIFTARALVGELKNHAPEIYSLAALPYEDLLEQFEKMPDISIDFAISEKSNKVIIFEGDFGWSDIGSFDSLSVILKGKKNKHLAIDSKNVFVHTTNNRFVATLGVDDINVIESSDSILIQKKGRNEEVKEIVKYLKENNCKEIEDSLIGYRPWGTYEILINTPTYKVKKIMVYPGSKLSLQSHYHRAEHWVVVKGLAKVINGEKELFLRENESTFIASLSTHRLENPGKINLELIEVQTGNYMEEDDIVRYDDIYERVK
jgi:mannose-1-phosphate guanylyltransferase / mannose-6-phosphate isomerase